MDERILEDSECESCPIDDGSLETAVGEPLRKGIARHKIGELSLAAGAAILLEGMESPHVYSLTRGVAYRHKSLSDGRRQILGYVFPGDLIGVQGSLLGRTHHGVDALSDVSLCVFDRECLRELFAQAPSAGYAVAWRAAKDECMLDEILVSVGRRTALESAAFLLALLHQRARRTGMAPRGRLAFPLTQQHVADALGLSVVHTNRTLKRLSAMKLISWQDRGCAILDEAGLLALAGWPGLDDTPSAA